MDIGCPSSAMRLVSSTIASKDISYYHTGWILTKLGRNDPYVALFNNFPMVPVRYISRSHRLIIDLYMIFF